MRYFWVTKGPFGNEIHTSSYEWLQCSSQSHGPLEPVMAFSWLFRGTESVGLSGYWITFSGFSLGRKIVG